jgi:hypothetical protein
LTGLCQQRNYVPLTATLKCPHERGKDPHAAEGIVLIASDEDGGVEKITKKEASEKIGVSYLQGKRILRAISEG